MTTDKLKDVSQALAFVLAVLFFILVAIGAAFGQEDVSTRDAQKPCDHLSNSFERFDAIRVHPASKVLNIEPIEQGQNLEVKTDGRFTTKITFFTLTKGTVYDPKAVKKGKMVWIVYSVCDRHVYAVTPVLPSQFK